MEQPPVTPPRFRVLAGHGVSHTVLAQLRQLLERLAGRTDALWILGPAQEADVLLLPRGLPLPAVAPPVSLVWLDAPGAPPGVGLSLAQPLQTEALLALLCEVERRQPPRRRPAGPPAWHRARAARTDAREAVPVPTRRAGGGPAWRDTGQLYRLQRWPEPVSQTGHRYLPRLASLLMSRSLRLSALAVLSNVSEAECGAFLAEMDRQGVLSRLPEDGPATPGAAPMAAPAAAPTAQNATGWLARLRACWHRPT